ncbi:MAG: histidine phosphatase family protein [Pseudohongiellaceae bacterium]|nr:histidine phosphatase family protein [Pseudohongiellaceae bacterium]
MKKLYLLRHAKAALGAVNIKDYDRPLNERGLSDARMMAQRLKSLGATLDLIVSSPALRAMTTAKIVAEVFDKTVDEVQLDRQIYLAGSPKLMQVVSYFDEAADSAMLVAHNPALTDLSHVLANSGIDNIPTAGLVSIEIPVDTWLEVGEGDGKVVAFDFPKSH